MDTNQNHCTQRGFPCTSLPFLDSAVLVVLASSSISFCIPSLNVAGEKQAQLCADPTKLRIKDLHRLSVPPGIAFHFLGLFPCLLLFPGPHSLAYMLTYELSSSFLRITGATGRDRPRLLFPWLPASSPLCCYPFSCHSGERTWSFAYWFSSPPIFPQDITLKILVFYAINRFFF